jgi:hypothetical protein
LFATAISQLDATRYDQLRNYVNTIIAQQTKNASATPALKHSSHYLPIASSTQPLSTLFQQLPTTPYMHTAPPPPPAPAHYQQLSPTARRSQSAKKKPSTKKKTAKKQQKASSSSASSLSSLSLSCTTVQPAAPLPPLVGSVFEKEEVVTMKRVEDEDEFVDIDSFDS